VTIQRLPLILVRLTALVLAFGTYQLTAAGVATDRARHGHFSPSAGNRLSASRSRAPGCELVLRDGSPPGEALAPLRDGPPSHGSPHLLLAATTMVALPRTFAARLAVRLPAEPAAPAASTRRGRGPPSR